MTQDMGIENKLPDLGGRSELDQKDNDSGSSWASSISALALSSSGEELLHRRSQPASHKIQVESEDEASEREMALSLSPVPLKRKRGRPPKNKSVEQPSQGKVQPPASTSKSQAMKPETKAPEPFLPRSKKILENDSPLEKRKRGRPPKVHRVPITPSAESPRKPGRPPKAGCPLVAHSAESPRKRGRPPKAHCVPIASSAESPHKPGQPPKAQCYIVAPSSESPRKRGRPPKAQHSLVVVTPSSESPRKRGRPPKAQRSLVVVTPSSESPRKRGRPPKAGCALVARSVESPRKRGRPPKIKSLEQLSQGEAQLLSGTPKSHVRKLETKAPELFSPGSETDSCESNTRLEKRKQGRPPKVRGVLVIPHTDLSHERHWPSKNKSPEINKGGVQPPPGVPTSHVIKLETKMPELSSPGSRTSELPGEGEAQPSPSAPKPHAQKPGSSAPEPASSRSKTVSSEQPLEKRRRGRPPKVPWAPAVPTAESPSKRKRGRPSKSPALPRIEGQSCAPGQPQTVTPLLRMSHLCLAARGGGGGGRRSLSWPAARARWIVRMGTRKKSQTWAVRPQPCSHPRTPPLKQSRMATCWGKAVPLNTPQPTPPIAQQQLAVAKRGPSVAHSECRREEERNRSKKKKEQPLNLQIPTALSDGNSLT
ncbi:basic salivary proline-rich protein 2-like [Gopherus flavomarginatus]|uniref:basic salivary proline-rich protein 2-like n=1 Tax=Gopherus flavomarginatus TaxID=286002 RepID=UPI0021CBE994|nr:basic salivary proline-rich protein 2-like [Gopherus flavomarginatus]